MENQELIGDQISPDQSQLDLEIGREEGSGSWDSLEKEEDLDISGEIETSQSEEGPAEINQDPEIEEEEEEQKNTLEDQSRRVLSFKDFFERN
jgi:hypothetical protein